MRKQLCEWCGRPKDEHGPPGESPLGKPADRLCPVPGVSSQSWTQRRVDFIADRMGDAVQRGNRGVLVTPANCRCC